MNNENDKKCIPTELEHAVSESNYARYQIIGRVVKKFEHKTVTLLSVLNEGLLIPAVIKNGCTSNYAFCKLNVGLGDIIGVQVAASIKNVFAIFMGMLTGMDMTDSYKASCLACLVRDLGEVIVALGGKRETIFTYAGLGDMLLTCMSSKSRNFTFGTYIGRGYSMQNAFETMSVKTVEGIYTLSTITDLMQSKNFKIKSLEVLYGILYNNDSKDNLLDKIRM